MLILQCRKNLLILKNTTGVQLYAAKFIIEECAYWNHPNAGWVKAKKHAERIEIGGFGYEIRFGANYFLVGLAISRCVDTLSALIDSWEKNNDKYSMQLLTEKLNLHIRGAIANNDGCEYKGYYPIHGNRIIFGTQAIDVKTFVGIIIESEVDKATSKSCSLWDMAVCGDLMSLYFLRYLY